MIDRYIYINGQKYINYYDYQNIEINCKIIHIVMQFKMWLSKSFIYFYICLFFLDKQYQ